MPQTGNVEHILITDALRTSTYFIVPFWACRKSSTPNRYLIFNFSSLFTSLGRHYKTRLTILTQEELKKVKKFTPFQYYTSRPAMFFDVRLLTNDCLIKSQIKYLSVYPKFHLNFFRVLHYPFYFMNPKFKACRSSTIHSFSCFLV